MIDITRLPRTQKKILQSIIYCAENDELPPTFEELAGMLERKSKINARRAVMELRDKGLVEMVFRNGRAVGRSVRPTQAVWDWWKSQRVEMNGTFDDDTKMSGITISEDMERSAAKGERGTEIFLRGQVAAGQPILAEDDASEDIALSNIFLGRDLFMLRVTGDSMSGDHIVKGDYVIVDPDAECKDGEMVVIRVKGEAATVKRIYRGHGGYRLESSNPQYGPMFVTPDDEPTLQGKVIGVIRHEIKRRYRMAADGNPAGNGISPE